MLFVLLSRMEPASCPIRWNISVKKNKHHVMHQPLHLGCSFSAVTGSKAVSNKERPELLRSKNGPKKTFEVIFRFVFESTGVLLPLQFFLCLHVWSFNAFRKVHPNCGGYQNNVCTSYRFTGWNLFLNKPGSVTQRWHDPKNEEGWFFLMERKRVDKNVVDVSVSL